VAHTVTGKRIATATQNADMIRRVLVKLNTTTLKDDSKMYLIIVSLEMKTSI